jgi:hypothetical protein
VTHVGNARGAAWPGGSLGAIIRRSVTKMTIRLPDAKHTRIKQLAARQGANLNQLIEEWSNVALAQFDAETRLRVRAARGNPAAGLALLDKLDLALTPRSRGK